MSASHPAVQRPPAAHTAAAASTRASHAPAKSSNNKNAQSHAAAAAPAAHKPPTTKGAASASSSTTKAPAAPAAAAAAHAKVSLEAPADYMADHAALRRSGPVVFDEEKRRKNLELRAALRDLMPIVDEYKASDCDLLYRFLIAHRWSLPDTEAAVRQYVQLRAAERVDTILLEEVDPDIAQVMSGLYGFDKDGLPLLWLFVDPPRLMDLVARRGSGPLLRAQMRTMEQARFLSRARGVDRCTYVIDLGKVTMSAVNGKSLGFVRELTAMLQQYYPEIMWRMLIFNTGWAVSGAWKVLKPFVDARVQDKIRFFNTAPTPHTLAEFVTADNVLPSLGGTGAVDEVARLLEGEVARLRREGSVAQRAHAETHAADAAATTAAAPATAGTAAQPSAAEAVPAEDTRLATAEEEEDLAGAAVLSPNTARAMPLPTAPRRPAAAAAAAAPAPRPAPLSPLGRGGDGDESATSDSDEYFLPCRSPTTATLGESYTHPYYLYTAADNNDDDMDSLGGADLHTIVSDARAGSSLFPPPSPPGSRSRSASVSASASAAVSGTGVGASVSQPSPLLPLRSHVEHPESLRLDLTASLDGAVTGYLDSVFVGEALHGMVYGPVGRLRTTTTVHSDGVCRRHAPSVASSDDASSSEPPTAGPTNHSIFAVLSPLVSPLAHGHSRRDRAGHGTHDSGGGGGPATAVIGRLVRESGHPVHHYLIVCDRQHCARFLMRRSRLRRRLRLFQVLGDAPVRTDARQRHYIEERKVPLGVVLPHPADPDGWQAFGDDLVRSSAGGAGGSGGARRRFWHRLAPARWIERGAGALAETVELELPLPGGVAAEPDADNCTLLAECRQQSVWFYGSLAALDPRDLFMLACGISSLWCDNAAN